MDHEINIEIVDLSLATLESYASISIAFKVESILDVRRVGDGPGEFVLTELPVEVPYVKDYDAFEADNPPQWARRFDISNWVLLVARVDGRRVGGAAIAIKTPGLNMLENRDDMAVLWDLRISAEARGKGVGFALFREVEAWSRAIGCRHLKIETQNTNVAACRFYARQGCVLGVANPNAYPECPDEIQLFWYKGL